jgi:transposase
MIDLARIDKIYLFTGTTDFRLEIFGLSKIVSSHFDKERIKNSLFLFCSKNRKSIKILELDETGVWLYHKKLNDGKFTYPSVGSIGIINSDELKILLNGLDFILRIEGKTGRIYDEY